MVTTLRRRDAYALLKSTGLCVDACGRSAQAGRVRCPRCRADRAAADRARRDRPPTFADFERRNP